MRTGSTSSSSFPVFLILLHVFKSHGLALLSPFCASADSNFSTCPDISTFDIVDTVAYAGIWYEIGSTAQSKLLSEAGLTCLKVNYTVQPSINASKGASFSVLNSGLRTLGPGATIGVTTVSAGSKDMCVSARDVCSYLGPSSELMQSIRELCKISYMFKDELPEQAENLNDVAQKIEGYAFNISNELPGLAEHVQKIQRANGYLSEANGTAATNVEQMKLAMVAICKHIDIIREFVDEMATARGRLVEVAMKLIIAGEFVSSADLTEASALIGAVEQKIVLDTHRIEATLKGINAASELIIADPDRFNRPISWELPGVATQNATFKGKFQLSITGLSSPYWIIALEGLPSQGYEAALVYSCTENHLIATIEQRFSIISRKRTIQPATFERLIGVVSSYGIDLDCDNPFLTSGCNCASQLGSAPTHI